MHESVAVPGPVTLVGLSEHAELLSDRLTTPTNPPRSATVMFEVPVEPALTITDAGPALTVKSVTLKDSHALVTGLLLASPLYMAIKP